MKFECARHVFHFSTDLSPGRGREEIHREKRDSDAIETPCRKSRRARENHPAIERRRCRLRVCYTFSIDSHRFHTPTPTVSLFLQLQLSLRGAAHENSIPRCRINSRSISTQRVEDCSSCERIISIYRKCICGQ